jgi:exopolysaccharide biosynthesis polyprenyl glycosylphosphotransferase
MNKRRRQLMGSVSALLVLDLVCLTSGILAAILIRLGPEYLSEYLFHRVQSWIFYVASICLAHYVSGSYGLQLKVSSFNQVINWLFAVLLALLVVSITSYAWLEMVVGRGVLGLAIGIYSILWLGANGLLYRYVLVRPRFASRVAILGTGPAAVELAAMMTAPSIRPVHSLVAGLHLCPVGGEGPEEQWNGVSRLTVSPQKLAECLHRLQVRNLIISPDYLPEESALYPYLRRLRFEGIHVMDPLTVAEIYVGRIPLEMIDEQWLTHAGSSLAPMETMRLKRLMGAIVASMALILLLPLGLAIALAIKLDHFSAPVFFRQRRVGHFGREFSMFKFRTMRPGADREKAVWSPVNDPRVTRLGRILRRYRLDELPQLINVVRGDMCLVGPRPEQPQIVAELEKIIPFYRERENVLPGITGWAQIRHPYGASVEDSRCKLEYDLYYIMNLSLTLDLRIILRTLRIMVLGLERQAP